MTDTLLICLYILLMAGVTYVIRMTPFVLFRKKLNSPFLESLFYYLPYAVLSAMVIPAVFSSTGNIITAAAGLFVAVVLAFFGRSLVTVALGASLAAYLAGLCLEFLPL